MVILNNLLSLLSAYAELLESFSPFGTALAPLIVAYFYSNSCLIQDETKSGCGDGDGVFNGVRHFQCEENNALFVNISSLELATPCRPKRRAKRSSSEPRQHVRDRLTNGSHSVGQPRLRLVRESEVKVGERVVWPSETGYERATVRWIGQLPGDENVESGETLVGVEFVSISKDACPIAHCCSHL